MSGGTAAAAAVAEIRVILAGMKIKIAAMEQELALLRRAPTPDKRLQLLKLANLKDKIVRQIEVFAQAPEVPAASTTSGSYTTTTELRELMCDMTNFIICTNYI